MKRVVATAAMPEILNRFTRIFLLAETFYKIFRHKCALISMASPLPRVNIFLVKIFSQKKTWKMKCRALEWRWSYESFKIEYASYISAVKKAFIRYFIVITKSLEVRSRFWNSFSYFSKRIKGFFSLCWLKQSVK